MPPLKWGILGAGSVAQRRVIPGMQSLEGHRVSALMVRDMNRAQSLAEKFRIPNAYSDISGLICDPEVDAVYVSSPVNLHRGHVLAAAEAGKHVLCEKPMAMTVGECQEMIAVCDRAGVQFQICFVMRGWAIYRHIREMIAEGRLGRVVEIRAHLAKWSPNQEGWRVDPAQSGGGVLMDMGAHYFDLFRFLVGDFSRVSAMGSSEVFQWQTEDTSFVITRFQNGAHGVMGLSFAIPFNGNVLEIYGSKGSLFLGSDLRVVTSAGEVTEAVVFPDYYRGLLENFSACVAGRANPIATGWDGLRNIEVIEAAYRSDRESRHIGL
ncbi:MAG: Gfo/Idh/MocA family oxidoreductase [bacterium]|nr:Gfo/Idh/MocA family oxidoreductase [bacterium]